MRCIKGLRRFGIEADPATRESLGAQWYTDRANRVERNWHSFVKNQDAGRLPQGWNPEQRNVTIFSSSDDEFVAIGAGWENKIYKDQFTGICEIVQQLGGRHEFDVYLRIHPNLADVHNQTKQNLLELQSPNLTIIPPEAKIDSYALLKSSEKAISFGSSVGIEAVFWGIPSVSLGPCVYQNLGGTYRPNNPKQALELIVDQLSPLSIEGALQYGYWSQTRGTKYQYFQADSLFEGRFKGEVIHANMHAKRPKRAVAQNSQGVPAFDKSIEKSQITSRLVRSRAMRKVTNSVCLTTVILCSILLLGCGGGSASNWPSNPQHDWIKNVNGRGMANVWGVIFDIEKFEGDFSINPKGEFGENHEDTDAENDIFFGNISIHLETTGERFFTLEVNGKQYGNVRRGDRVKVDKDRDVAINNEYREGVRNRPTP